MIGAGGVMEAPASDAGRTSSRWTDIVAFALLWIPYAALVWRFWWVCDDAYISFRYARNLALGRGLRYNLGDEPPVEGYSNFLWTIACAAIEALQLNPEVAANVLSFACGSVLLWRVYAVLRGAMGLNVVAAYLSALTLACFPPFAVWSTSGMETALFALLLFVTFERLIVALGPQRGIAAGLAGLALALVRTEGLAWSILIGLCRFVQGRDAPRGRGRELAVYFAIVLLGFSAYYVGRFAYYKTPVANTAYVKVGMSSMTLERGFNYVATHALTFATPIFLIPAGVLAVMRGPRRMTIPTALLCISSASYAVVVGGDFMAMGRLLVPGVVSLGTLAVGAALGYAWRLANVFRCVAAGACLSSVAIGLLPAWDLHLIPERTRFRFPFRYSDDERLSELAKWDDMSFRAERNKYIGIMLGRISKPGDSSVMPAIGARGYYSDLYVFDSNGLVTPEVARRPHDGLRRSPGHDKLVEATYFLKNRPTSLAANWLDTSKARETAARYAESFKRVYRAPGYVPELHGPFDDLPRRPSLLIFRSLKAGETEREAQRAFDERLERLP